MGEIVRLGLHVNGGGCGIVRRQSSSRRANNSVYCGGHLEPWPDGIFMRDSSRSLRLNLVLLAEHAEPSGLEEQ